MATLPLGGTRLAGGGLLRSDGASGLRGSEVGGGDYGRIGMVGFGKMGCNNCLGSYILWVENQFQPHTTLRNFFLMYKYSYNTK